MSVHGNTQYTNFFSSLISDIKAYNGNDPLLPWLRGISKMKETLSAELLKEKLPRFLQKCSETFLTDRRYSNDLRYLRVWLQVMDYVDNPKEVLKTMEKNRIGLKRSLFYRAYALYYEKVKRFDSADRIYRQGAENLAEPADELQKAYDQFLHRMEHHRKKRAQHQGGKLNNTTLAATNVGHYGGVKGCIKKSSTASNLPTINQHKQHFPASQTKFVNTANMKAQKYENGRICSEDTVVNFLDTAIGGKSNTEDARHHGLVEPTINTKEAMNAIYSMFREPLEPSDAGRRSHKNQPKTGNSSDNEFKVFTDESIEDASLQQNIQKAPSTLQVKKSDANQPLDEPFSIYVDGEETDDVEEVVSAQDIEARMSRGVMGPDSHVNPVVFVKPNDPPESSKDSNPRRVYEGLREDTVVSRFVGSAISDEPRVENVLHHGLVEPTINFKEAMNDINSMFGKPIEYVRKSRSKKQNPVFDAKNNPGDFLIYPDDESDNQTAKEEVNCMFQKSSSFAKKTSPRKQDQAHDMMESLNDFLILSDDDSDEQAGSSGSSAENISGLFEKTLCTKEAMDEINKLFAMPMDF